MVRNVLDRRLSVFREPIIMIMIYLVMTSSSRDETMHVLLGSRD